MFIHAVLFEISPKESGKYRKDSLMWAGYAVKARGFICYYTMKRLGFKNQYISVYEWKTKEAHSSFMNKFHDRLVGKSSAKVKVLDYYNFKAVDKVKKNCN